MTDTSSEPSRGALSEPERRRLESEALQAVRVIADSLWTSTGGIQEDDAALLARVRAAVAPLREAATGAQGSITLSGSAGTSPGASAVSGSLTITGGATALSATMVGGSTLTAVLTVREPDGAEYRPTPEDVPHLLLQVLLRFDDLADGPSGLSRGDVFGLFGLLFSLISVLQGLR